MPILARMLRNVPGVELRPYFAERGIHFSEPVEWNGLNGRLIKSLRKTIDASGKHDRERIDIDARRIDRMTAHGR